MAVRLLKLALICSFGLLSTAIPLCHGNAPEPESDISVYERRLIEQTRDELRASFKRLGNDDETAAGLETILQRTIPPTSLDLSKLKVEYTDAKGNVAPSAPGTLRNLFVLRGTFRNNHERFRLLRAVVRVSLKDCVGGRCKPLGTTAFRMHDTVPITSEEETYVPLLFPSPMTLKGTLQTEVEVVACWGQLDPAIAAKMSAELEEMEAEEAREAHEDASDDKNATAS